MKQDPQGRSPRRSRALRDWLAAPGDARAVTEHARRLLALQLVLDACLPAGLRGQVRVSNFRQGLLVAGVGGGALAHRLRTLAPQLVEALRAKQIAVVELRAEVRPAVSPPPSPPKRAVLGPMARESIERLAASLPDSPMRSALERMARRARLP
jgi:hypothetical protein